MQGNKGLLRAIVVTAVLTCSLTINVVGYYAYAKPAMSNTSDYTAVLEQLPVTKKGN